VTRSGFVNHSEIKTICGYNTQGSKIKLNEGATPY